jgi:FkbM family methyltransferase
MNKLRIFFLKKIFASFFFGKDCISLIDIGAEGGLEPRWRDINEFLHYTGVEPDNRSSKVLVKSGTPFRSFRIIPFALWSTSKELQLNLCRQPSASSVFEPNKDFLNRFPRVERFDVEKVIQIQAKKLNEILEGNVDFLKIDTQGAELEIIKGAVDNLKNAIGLEVEVQFHKIYVGEPLFQDVSSYLESHNFEFIDFVHLKRWGRYKLDNRGQLVFADALFLRSPEYILQKGSIELSQKYIAICLIYNRFDFVNIILDSNVMNNNVSNKIKKYIKILEFIQNITFLFTRGISNIQRRVHSNYRSHFLY